MKRVKEGKCTVLSMQRRKDVEQLVDLSNKIWNFTRRIFHKSSKYPNFTEIQ